MAPSHHTEHQEAAPSRDGSLGADGVERYNRGVLFSCIDADPDRLLQPVLDAIRLVEDHERRSGQTIRFRKRGSLSISTSVARFGSWRDFNPEGGARDHGNLWQLAQRFGFTAEDIARFYPECWTGAPPKKVTAIKRKAIARERQAAVETLKIDDIDEQAIRANVKAASVKIDGNFAGYLKSRRINPKALAGQILAVERPLVVLKKDSDLRTYRLHHRSIMLPITNDAGFTVGAQFTQITGHGTKAEGKKCRHSLGSIGQGYGRIGQLSSDAIVMGEGLETVGSCLEANPRSLGLVSVGNIRTVPGDRDTKRARIIILAPDRDQIEHVEKKAHEIAKVAPRAIIKIAVPPAAVEGDKTDFNDVHQKLGIAAVRKALKNARTLIEPKIGKGTVSLDQAQLECAATARSFLANVELKLKGQAAKAEAHSKLEAEVLRAGLHLDDPDVKKALRRGKMAATRSISKDLGVKVTGRAQRVMLEGTPGVGKTFASHRELGSFIARIGDVEGGFTAAVLLPTTATAREKYAEFKARFPDITSACIRGRSSQHTDEGERVDGDLLEYDQDAAAMCPRHEAYNALSRRGVPGKRVICGSCPLAEHCQYLKQEAWLKATQHQVRVIFGVHAHAGMPASQRPWRRQDLLVVDENIIGSLSVAHNLPLSVLTDAKIISKMVKRKDLELVEMTAQKLSDAVQARSVSSLSMADLKAFNKTLRDFRPSVFTISGADADAELIETAARMPGRYRDALLSLAGDAMRHLKHKAQSWKSIIISWDANGDRLVDWVTSKKLNASRNCHILALDGTSQEPLTRLVFGDHLKTIKVRVERRCHVTQTTGATFSRTSLLGIGSDEDDDQQSTEVLLNVIGSLRDIEGRMLLGADKRVIEAAKQRTLDTDLVDIWDRIDTLHLGAGSATNIFEGIGTVVIVGRLSPPVDAIERQGYALAMLKGRTIVTVDQFRKDDDDVIVRRDGYIDRNGQAWHPDPICEALRWTVTNATMIQLIDRARPVRKEVPINVVLINSIDLEEFPADDFIKASSVKNGCLVQSRFERYLNESYPLKVVPISPVVIQKLRPDLWESIEAAKHELKRLFRTSTGSQIKKGQTPLRYSTRVAPFKSRLSELSIHLRVWIKPGQRKPFRAMCEPGFTEADIERAFGKFFRWERIEPESDATTIAHEHQKSETIPPKLQASARHDDLIELPSAPDTETIITRAIRCGCLISIPGWKRPRRQRRVRLATACIVCGETCTGVMPTDYALADDTGRRVHTSCQILLGADLSPTTTSPVLELCQ